MTAARQYVAGADPRRMTATTTDAARFDGLVQRYGGTCTVRDDMPQGRKAVRWDGPNGEQVELVAPTVGELVGTLGRALAIHTTQQG
jgi:hypothetical protein